MHWSRVVHIYAFITKAILASDNSLLAKAKRSSDAGFLSIAWLETYFNQISIEIQKKNDLIWKCILQTGGRFVRSQHFNRLDKQSSKNAGDHFFFTELSRHCDRNVHAWMSDSAVHPNTYFRCPTMRSAPGLPTVLRKLCSVSPLYSSLQALLHMAPHITSSRLSCGMFFFFFFVCLGFIGRLGGLMPPIQPHFPELLHWRWDNKTIATLYDCPGTIKVMIVKKNNTHT